MNRTSLFYLAFLLIAVILSGCQFAGVGSALSDSVECVRVENLINPDSTSYNVVSETGIGLKTKTAGYKESNQHTFKVDDRGYSRTHLLIRVENASGLILNERKSRLRFRSRRNQIGCRIIALSNPGELKSIEFE